MKKSNLKSIASAGVMLISFMLLNGCESNQEKIDKQTEKNKEYHYNKLMDEYMALHYKFIEVAENMTYGCDTLTTLEYSNLSEQMNNILTKSEEVDCLIKKNNLK